MPHKCAQCGASFIPQNKRGKPSRFCGHACRNRSYYEQRGRQTARPAAKTMSCALCGQDMWRSATSLPEGRARCQPCRRASRPEPKPKRPDWGTKSWRDCEICGQRYRAKMKAQRTCGRACALWLRSSSCRVDWMTCSICDKPYARAVGRAHETCSLACTTQARAILYPPAVKDDSWKYEDRECPRCGVTFRLADRGIYMAPQTLHCSNRCTRKASKLKRKVRESGSFGEWRWSDFMRIARKFNYCCAYCGEKPDRLDPDHVIPLAKGGPNTTSNLLPSCPTCNSDKTDFLLHEWAEHRALKGKPPRNTSWADEDPRYFHLTAVRSMLAAA